MAGLLIAACATETRDHEASSTLCFLGEQPATAPGEALAIIEIPAGGREKNELDPRTGELIVDRILPDSISYPAAYGTFPCTLAGDGDPLDVLVLTDSALAPGTRLSVRPIGVLRMVDAGEQDDKLLAVPLSSPMQELPPDMQRRLSVFFSVYKPGGSVVLNGWEGTAAAAHILTDAIAAARVGDAK